MKNSESKSIEHPPECQGCGNNDGLFNCVECHAPFCMDCIDSEQRHLKKKN